MTKERKKGLIFKAVFVFIALGMVVLSCIFLIEAPRLVLLLAIIIFSSCGVLIASSDATKNETIVKFLSVLLSFGAIALITYIILLSTGVLDRITDAEALTELIRSTGYWGMLVFFLIVVLEVVMLPIPSAATAFVGAKLFSPFPAFLIMSAGTIVGSIIAFSLGKIFGQKLVAWMIGKEKTEKYSTLLNEKGKGIFVLMMLFPFFPDDILCLAAGVTKMSYKFFILVVSLTRPVFIAFMTFFVGGNIIPFRGWGIGVWIGIFALSLIMLFIITKFKNKIMKNKPQKEKKQKPTKIKEKTT
ncbi:MAG: VTT domain-containing protein [Firmicutes bacterium]|nr:VTT domain-containing protein [Bacillota bacterium]